MQEPPLVSRARDAASDEDAAGRLGPLLHVLARSVGRGRVGAAGLEAAADGAWLAAALDPGESLVVVEEDAARAARLAELLGEDPDAFVIAGGLADLDAHCPFDLLVLGPRAHDLSPVTLLALLAPRGLAVVEPVRRWPARPELVVAELADGVELVARR